ncbi:MAG: DNA primase, partial [Gammaproteobacteria bacterium]|nr:DNA primase [Gammaproteobacteria bacterium]
YKPDHDSNAITLKKLYAEYRAFCVDGGCWRLIKINFRKRLERSKILIDKDNRGLIVFVSTSLLELV